VKFTSELRGATCQWYHTVLSGILIERIQKRFTRMILSIKEFPYEVR